MGTPGASAPPPGAGIPTAGARSGGQQAPDPYQPSTDLTGAQDANYQDWFKQNDQTGQRIQDLATQQAALGNRKAAYLASMSGGNGGYYQSGQIAAGIAGQNTMQQGLLQNDQARGQIYGNKAAALGSLGMGAQGYGNQLGIQHDQQQFTAGREDKKAQDEARTGGIQAQNARTGESIKSHYGDNPNSDAYNDYNAISAQIDQAIAAGDYTTAQSLQDQLNNFNYSGYGHDGKRKQPQGQTAPAPAPGAQAFSNSNSYGGL
jgi:hypothetical protein